MRFQIQRLPQDHLRFCDRRFSAILYSCALCLIGLVIGCAGGGDDVPIGTVSGSIMIQGKPLTQGRVNFVSTTSGGGGYADLNDDGTFEVLGPLPAGKYVVFLTPVGLGDQPPSEKPVDDRNMPLANLPKQVQDEATTNLTAIVKVGDNQFDFKI